MPKRVIMDTTDIVNSTDWEGKANKIIEELKNSIFNGLTKEDSYDIKYDKFGNEIKKKKTVKKNEVMPDISVTQVTNRLNQLLRIYRPMSKEDALSLEDLDYLQAYNQYMNVINYINEYTNYIGSRQTYSAFVNITTDVYEELLVDPSYSAVFKSFEDSFIESNFATAQAGLIDSKMTIAKLQTKGSSGHSLMKTAESITFVQNNRIDKALIHAQLDKFSAMLPNKGKK